VITARRTVFAIVLALAALAAGPAVAGRIGDEAPPDRILIANPSSSLEAHLIAGGFVLESVERLDALKLSLMIAAPPRAVAAADALQQLRAEFPSAIIALDDPFHLATDAHSAARQVQRPAARADVHRLANLRHESGCRPSHRRHRQFHRSRASGLARRAHRQAQFHLRQRADHRHGARHGDRGDAGRPDRTAPAIAGLLRGATLFHAGIFQKGKRGPVASSGDFLRAVDWLVRSGVTVINASITSETENPVVLYAMSMLSHEGVMLVAAAGNRGPNGPPAYPAAFESAFAVTAVSLDGDAYEHANTGDYIDIAAPGIDLPTTSRRITSGTSLAVPFVTAAVARMVQMCGVSPIQAEESLQANARDLGTPGRDSSFGWGLLQAPRCAAPQLSARHPSSSE
jgi:subtilisin family serine protease